MTDKCIPSRVKKPVETSWRTLKNGDQCYYDFCLQSLIPGVCRGSLHMGLGPSQSIYKGEWCKWECLFIHVHVYTWTILLKVLISKLGTNIDQYFLFIALPPHPQSIFLCKVKLIMWKVSLKILALSTQIWLVLVFS